MAVDTTLQDQFVKRKQETADQISNLYDKKYQADAAALKNAYDQNVSNTQAEMSKVAPQYQTSANQLAAQNFKTVRNTNLNALNSGLNSGTAVQQREALSTAYMNNYSGLRNEEASKLNAYAQNIANYGIDYRNALSEKKASAENDKAASLVKNMNTQNDWYDTQAKTLASYGDFSGYASLYGENTADSMKNVWIIQNPETAYHLGMIDSARYKTITGHDPGSSS